jgi:hypothetical protein
MEKIILSIMLLKVQGFGQVGLLFGDCSTSKKNVPDDGHFEQTS